MSIKRRIAAGVVGGIMGAGVGMGAGGEEAPSPPTVPRDPAVEHPEPSGESGRDHTEPIENPWDEDSTAEQPPNTVPDQVPNVPVPPEVALDNRLPWEHMAEQVGPENATPKIMEQVEYAKANGWQVIGNDKDGGEGAFVSITSPKGATTTATDPNFNSKVNQMLDIPQLKIDDGVLGGGNPQNQGPGSPPKPPKMPPPKKSDEFLGGGRPAPSQGPEASPNPNPQTPTPSHDQPMNQPTDVPPPENDSYEGVH